MKEPLSTIKKALDLISRTEVKTQESMTRAMAVTAKVS